MPLIGTEVGLSPGNIVLDGDPAPPQRSTAPPCNFRPMSIVAKRSPISATAEHLHKRSPKKEAASPPHMDVSVLFSRSWLCACLDPPDSTSHHLDRFGRFCTADGGQSLYLTGCTFPLKIALLHRGICSPSNTWFLGPTPKYKTQTASRSVQLFFFRAHDYDRQTVKQTTPRGP